VTGDALSVLPLACPSRPSTKPSPPLEKRNKMNHHSGWHNICGCWRNLVYLLCGSISSAFLISNSASSRSTSAVYPCALLYKAVTFGKTLEISRPISRQRSAAVSRALFPFWPLSPGVGSFSFTCREGEPIHVLIRWYGWSVAHVVVPM
jgi:hypothetical protein